MWVFEVCTVGDYGKHRRVIVEVPNCGVTEVKPEGQSFKSSFFFFFFKVFLPCKNYDLLLCNNVFADTFSHVVIL